MDLRNLNVAVDWKVWPCGGGRPWRLWVCGLWMVNRHTGTGSRSSNASEVWGGSLSLSLGTREEQKNGYSSLTGLLVQRSRRRSSQVERKERRLKSRDGGWTEEGRKQRGRLSLCDRRMGFRLQAKCFPTQPLSGHYAAVRLMSPDQKARG